MEGVTTSATDLREPSQVRSGLSAAAGDSSFGRNNEEFGYAHPKKGKEPIIADLRYGSAAWRKEETERCKEQGLPMNFKFRGLLGTRLFVDEEKREKGVTILAVVFKDGAFVAVNHSPATKPKSLPKDIEHIAADLDPDLLKIISNEDGILPRDFEVKCSLQDAAEKGTAALSRGKCHTLYFRNKEDYSGTLFVRWNSDKEGPELFGIDGKGKFHKGNFGRLAFGSGARHAVANLDLKYFTSSTHFEEAADWVAYTISIAALAGRESRGLFSIYHVERGGKWVLVKEGEGVGANLQERADRRKECSKVEQDDISETELKKRQIFEQVGPQWR